VSLLEESTLDNSSSSNIKQGLFSVQGSAEKH
jgi:hypothetical protein